ncbi:Krueppel 1 [Nymphon striatum]|nr:Krueppel 1 [Nymphon striatum]
MADRGFTISESVAMAHAKLVIPAFTKRKNQLDPVDVEKTKVIANHNDTNTSPSPVWMSLDVKTIKEEKEEFPCSVLDHFDGSSTEEINRKRQNKEHGRITIKKEIEQNYTDIASSPDWVSFEIKKIKEENEDPPSGVIDIRESTPHRFEHEDDDKGYNQETCKNVPNSTFSNIFDENTGDVYGNCLSTKRSIRTHKSELTTDTKANKCNTCYEYFLDSSQLARHVCMHTNEKPFECDICHKCFSQKGGLKLHMSVHTREKPFECGVCHKYFTQAGSLNRHMHVHTNEKRIECDVCCKSFSEKKVLKHHMSVHTREKPFEFVSPGKSRSPFGKDGTGHCQDCKVVLTANQTNLQTMLVKSFHELKFESIRCTANQLDKRTVNSQSIRRTYRPQPIMLMKHY